MEYALYQVTPEKHNRGTYFYTSCCNNMMYNINNEPMLYHGKLCPKCLNKNRTVTLYYDKSEDAFEKRKEGKLIEFGR